MNEANSNLVISHYTLRKAIGWLGMLLPFVLLVGNFCINHSGILNNPTWIDEAYSQPYTPDASWKTSISHYYYTTVGELFTGLLIAVSLFLFSYKGHALRPGERGLSDNALTNLAALGALVVVIFPTGTDTVIADNVRTFVSSSLTQAIHFTGAACFFVSLALLCLINFRRSGDGSFGTKKYHRRYFICGAGMLACIALIGLYSSLLEGEFSWLDAVHPVYTLETIALAFFGLAWLTKGRVDFLYLPKKLHLIKSSAN